MTSVYFLPDRERRLARRTSNSRVNIFQLEWLELNTPPPLQLRVLSQLTRATRIVFLALDKTPLLIRYLTLARVLTKTRVPIPFTRNIYGARERLAMEEGGRRGIKFATTAIRNEIKRTTAVDKSGGETFVYRLRRIS